MNNIGQLTSIGVSSISLGLRLLLDDGATTERCEGLGLRANVDLDESATVSLLRWAEDEATD